MQRLPAYWQQGVLSVVIGERRNRVRESFG